MNRCYLYSNVKQLLNDIIACASCDVDGIINTPSYKDKNLDSVEKFALLLALKDNSQYLVQITNALSDFPLLQYRVDNFSNHIFKDSKSIYEYIHRHENRIRWHIMRIYRNRNMIVHSGSSMPYRNIIVENLHFYVDVLLDTLIEYYHIDLLNHASIYEGILAQQISYYVTLGVPLDNKGKQTVVSVTDDIISGQKGRKRERSMVK